MSTETREGSRLIDAAIEFAPLLRSRAAKVDLERRVPDETFAAFQEAGLFRTFKPKYYGGLELGIHEHAMIALNLARGCPSSGWVFSLVNECSWFISMMDQRAQEDVWGQDLTACAAGSIRADASRSSVEVIDGGYRVNGQYPFASGSDHVQWIFVSGFLPSPKDGSPTTALFLVPKHELTMIDDWHVLGMRGTGSRSYKADDVFVPEHRMILREDLWAANAPGKDLHKSWALLQSPRSTLHPFIASAPTVGIGLGAVDEFASLVADKGLSILDSTSGRLTLAEAAAETDAARLIVDEGTREQTRYIDAREPIPDELHERLARDSAYVGILTAQAVSRLHRLLGSSAIFQPHPLERALRDVHTAIAQAGLHWELNAQGYSAYLLNRATSATIPRTDVMEAKETNNAHAQS